MKRYKCFVLIELKFREEWMFCGFINAQTFEIALIEIKKKFPHYVEFQWDIQEISPEAKL